MRNLSKLQNLTSWLVLKVVNGSVETELLTSLGDPIALRRSRRCWWHCGNYFRDGGHQLGDQHDGGHQGDQYDASGGDEYFGEDVE